MGRYKALGVNIVLFALNTFATKLISFVLVPIYTAHFTQAEYGISDLLTSITWMLFPLATFSLSDAAMRFMFDDENNRKSYMSVGFWGIVLSCILVLGFLPALDFSFFGGLGHYKMWFFVAYIANAYATYSAYVARGLNQIKLIAVASIAQSLVMGLTSVWTIAYLKIGVIGYFYAFTAGCIISILCYVIGGKHYRYITLSKQILPYLKPMLVYSIPLIPNAFFWWMGTNINRLFITGILGISAAGMYVAATKIPTILNLVFSIFQQAWQLSIFEEFKKKGVEQFVGNVFSFVNALLLIGTSTVIVVSPWFAGILLKKDFYNAWTLIPLLLLASYFNILTSFFGTLFTASMDTRRLFYSTVVGAVLCIILSYVLIMYASLNGAALAVIISNGTVMLLRLRDTQKIMPLHFDCRSWVACLCLIVVQIALIVSGQYHLGIQLAALAVIIVIQCVTQYPFIRWIVKQVMSR